MCGIVAYFGRAENPLTRILTGMWSIIYRAPDSTGVAMFGDELSPVRTRKALGSVQDLVEVLNEKPLYMRSSADLAAGLVNADHGHAEWQEVRRRLLRLEGLSTEDLESKEKGELPYIHWAGLTDRERERSLVPGMVGRPGTGSGVTIHSKKDFRRTIEHLMFDHDLPPLVVKSVFRHFLSRSLQAMSETEAGTPPHPETVMRTFDLLFDNATEFESTPSAEPEPEEKENRHPSARRYVWRALLKKTIPLPADYDIDGVRRLFCCLDSLVMSRLGRQPDLDERVHKTMTKRFQEAGRGAPAPWQTLYRAERALNVYGIAASSVYSVLFREHDGLYSRQLPGMSPEEGVVPGQTVPGHLASLGQPILAHGRWALQSQVTLRNTHPFVDQQRIRSACINGQFSSEVERRVHRFLTKVANIRLRSENSTEYFVQLWGYYAGVLSMEKTRSESIREQVSLGLDDLAVGTHSIDYQLFYRLRDASPEVIEERAFILAMQVMIQDGGQVAVAGMSLLSPHRLFAASHNRPLFVVQRKQGSEVMLVSDVNAALGLFSQRQIQKSARKLKNRQHPAREALSKQFEVMVTPMQGESLFARVESRQVQNRIRYSVRIMDFTGQEHSDIDPFYTRLSPVQIKRSLNRTFYEMHLREIPACLEEILEAYLPASEKPDLARFGINRRLLTRRFGSGLSSLRRLFLVGIGSSWHAACMAKNMVRSLIPEMPVVVLSPVEVEDIARTIDADRDLVVCLSWSGTTADMVQFAKDVHRQHIVAVGITEKPFSDMALVLRKSGGVFPVFSGEEVTVSAVKSLLCMLLGLEGFCLALLHELGHWEKAEFVASRMKTLPDAVREVLQNPRLREWSRSRSNAYNHSMCHLVLDTQHSVGTGMEIALKLEENSWLSMGKTFDFRDVETAVFSHWRPNNLILVNATNMVRLQEAMACMKRLHAAGLDYALVSFEHEYLDHMREVGGVDPVCLPKVDDMLQPFVDLVFYMRFGLDFGLAHGRLPGEFPRNRAKSVTAGRSRPAEAPGPGREIADLGHKNEKWEALPDMADPLAALNRVSYWEERKGVAGWEGDLYRDLRGLCSLLREGDAFGKMLDIPDERMRELAGFILDQLTVDGEIIFLPLDKAAQSAARTLARYWTQLLGCFIRVESPAARLHTAGGDALVILLASYEPDDYVLENVLPDLEQNFIWIGPPIDEYFARVFTRLGTYAPLLPDGLRCRQDLLYAALSLFFTRILAERRPGWADVLRRHFSLSGLAVAATLNDRSLWKQINDAVYADRGYETALFIGPATGNGAAWVRRFDRYGRTLLEWYDFGFAAHGPLVTVDNRVAEKFVALGSRQELAGVYGEKRVRAWEKKYFQGRSLDNVFGRDAVPPEQAPVSPFYAQRQWYLPELKAGYDCGLDNPVIIDATSERSFGQALDELSTFGCRFARMTVISQGAFSTAGRLSAFNPHPLSHLLLLPDLGEPFSDLLLPFLQTLISTAMAARTNS